MDKTTSYLLPQYKAEVCALLNCHCVLNVKSSSENNELSLDAEWPSGLALGAVKSLNAS